MAEDAGGGGEGREEEGGGARGDGSSDGAMPAAGRVEQEGGLRFRAVE
jgi:hypothetical protein